MERDKYALSPLQDIELWCCSIASANTVTAKCAGMLGLLMELEYAIEKYKSMAERLKTELPLDVTAHDFEEWTGKFDEFRSTYLLENIKYYSKEYFSDRGDDDQDIINEFSEPGFEGLTDRIMGIPIPVINIDEKLIQNIADGKNNNDWIVNYPSQKQLEEGIDIIRSAREGVLKLEVYFIIEEKMKLLSDEIDIIIQQLTAPTKDAILDVYTYYNDEFTKDGGNKLCERLVAEWVADHEDKTNILELFDKKIASIREEIKETFYGDKWDEFFDTTDDDIQPINKTIGRFIFRNQERFNDTPDYIKQFLSHIYLWLSFNWERMKTKERILNPESNIQCKNPDKSDNNVKPILGTVFSPELYHNVEASKALIKLVKEKLDPTLCTGKRADKWSWGHVQEAFKQVGFVETNCDNAAFGRAMVEINGELKAENVKAACQRYSAKAKANSDKNLIENLVRELTPINNMLKG